MTVQSQILDVLSAGLGKVYSAAQIVVGTRNQILFSEAIGQTHLYGDYQKCCTKPSRVTPRSLFDIASVTKPLSTAALIMCAVDDGRLSIDQKLVSLNWLTVPPWLLGNTIGDLLSHQTELPAWKDLHGNAPRLEDHERACEYFEREIQNLLPREDGSTWCYSDFGYILLGILLERIYKKPLDILFLERIARPLGLSQEMMYRPLHRTSQKSIVATALHAGVPLQGHPDDANTRALTHMAGHAGLFATAESISLYIQKLLTGKFPCSSKVIYPFLTYRSERTPFALGWDRPTSLDSLSGRKPGENVIGHLGFTGCSVWIDLENHSHVTLLTNRTHVNPDPKSLSNIRREVHKLSWSLL